MSQNFKKIFFVLGLTCVQIGSTGHGKSKKWSHLGSENCRPTKKMKIQNKPKHIKNWAKLRYVKCFKK